MPSFGAASLSRITTCHPDLQIIFAEVVKIVDCSVICGHRDEIVQQEYFSDGRSKVQYPNSKHNSYPSMAADVAPYPIDWEDIRRFDRFAGIVHGVANMLYKAGEITHLIRDGGDWDRDTQVKDNKFNDLLHFELIRP